MTESTAIGAFPADKTAIVTGAASPRGIGRVTAKYLAAQGWSIAIIDLDQEAAQGVAAEVSNEFGVATVGIGASVTDPEQIDAAVTKIEQELPQIVGLVNIAGISSATEFFDVTSDEWDRVLAVNLKGTFIVTQRVARTMTANGVGRVVSLSSISAQRGGGTFSKVPYSAAKAGVVGFTRAVAREISPLGVTVNAISPGPIDTDIMGGTLTDERKASLSSGVMVGRVGAPGEVAALIGFLLSEEAAYITAVNYDINGGLHTS